MSDEDRVYLCSNCHIRKVEYQRWKIGKHICKPCGEEQAQEARKSWCVAPMNKSNYTLITDPTMLRQLNPKRTT